MHVALKSRKTCCKCCWTLKKKSKYSRQLPKSLHPSYSVWSKITLITGSVGGAGTDPHTFKTGKFLLIPWHYVSQFSIHNLLRNELRYVSNKNYYLRLSWFRACWDFLLKISMPRKKCLNFTSPSYTEGQANTFWAQYRIMYTYTYQNKYFWQILYLRRNK